MSTGIYSPKCAICKKRQCMKDKANPTGFRLKCGRCSRSARGYQVALACSVRQSIGPSKMRDPKTVTRIRSNALKRLYGITVEDYDRIVSAQGNLCAICGRPETKTYKGRQKRLCVDHDHGTGKFRGVVCANCNFVLASVDAVPGYMDRVRRYLERAVTLDTGA